MLLRDDSFRVHAARDAEEARLMLGVGAFDAAVVDFEVWTTGETQFPAAVGEHRPDMAIVLLVDSQDGESAIEAAKLGVHACVERSLMATDHRLARSITSCVVQNRTTRRRDTMVRWLERESLTDHLTGLHNRRAFDDRLRSARDSARTTGRPVSLILADVAGTGTVNDVHGRDAGDSMIRRAASVLARSIRGVDFAARVGGDNFGIIISDGDIELGRLVARRMAQIIERLNNGEWDGDIPVTVTFGIASGTHCEAANLFSAAEDQMLEQKSFHPVAPMLWLRKSEDGPSVA